MSPASDRLDRGAARARRAFTLIEVLVAMALTGIVGTLVGMWIVHESRVRMLSDRRIELEESVSLWRDELFQDLHHGRILFLSQRSWAVLRQGDGVLDTLVWSLDEGVPVKTFRGTERRPLAGLTDLKVRWNPLPVAGFSAVGTDSWWSLDLDLDGVIQGRELDSVLSLEVSLEATHRTLAGMAEDDVVEVFRVPVVGL